MASVHPRPKPEELATDPSCPECRNRIACKALDAALDAYVSNTGRDPEANVNTRCAEALLAEYLAYREAVHGIS